MKYFTLLLIVVAIALNAWDTYQLHNRVTVLERLTVIQAQFDDKASQELDALEGAQQ